MTRCLRVCAQAMAVLLSSLGWAATAPDAIVGAWLSDDGGSKVSITASASPAGGTVYAGTVAWLKEPTRDGQPLRDASNADAALRGRPIMGLTILSGFKATAAGGWSGGSIYSPRSGRSFPAELSLMADGRLQIKVQAGVLSRTVYWTR